MKQLTLKDKQKMWALAWQESGDQAAIEKLVESCMGFVYKQSASVAGWSGIEREDLNAEGVAGIVKAANVFDPEKGTFSGLAFEWIRSYIHLYAQNNWSVMTTPKSSIEYKLQQQLLPLFDEYKEAGWGNQRALELAAKDLGASPTRAAAVMGMKNGRKSLAADASDDESDSGVHLVDHAETAEAECGKEQVKKIIADMLENLGERERYIITRRFLSDEKCSLEKVGKELGVSRTRVTKVEAEALRHLGLEFKRMGIRLSDMIGGD